MRKLSPRALAIAAGHNRGRATWVLALAVGAAISLWLSAGGSAATSSHQGVATSSNQIAVSGTTTMTLAQHETKSTNPITFAQKAKLTCAPQPNGQPSTCTAIATLIGAQGPLTDIPLATYAHIFTSADNPVTLTFGLSHHTLDLLYQHRGDPRCTVVVAIVNDSSAAGTTGLQGAAPTPGTGSQSSTPARSFTAYINVPPGP
jgi:hypothetical protein